MGDTLNERVQRIIDAYDHKKPDHTPALAMVGTWAIANAGGTVKEMEENPILEKEYYLKTFDTLYCDAVMTGGIVNDAKSFELIGSGAAFASNDGTSIQHKENIVMGDDEYPKLIAEPYEFVVNEILPRKAEKLRGDFADNYEAMSACVQHRLKKAEVQKKLVKELRDRDIPVFNGAVLSPPLDMIFDFLRGFRGLAVDLRRRPELVEEACDKLMMYSEAMLGYDPTVESYPAFPIFGTMAHSPNFIRPKQFEQLWWKYYLKLAKPIWEKGGRTCIYCEGTWTDKLDIIQDVPKNQAAFHIAPDGMYQAKEKLGDNSVIVGGMAMNELRFKSKEECLDLAKKYIEDFGADGGYIFTIDRELVCPNDVNTENLEAVYEFVHNY
ncbi:MAG: hypothetical protein J6B94_12725 [Lachnospiraceae bacterium]|nr:hypothetical protein [Lachnospiraceae bacterium]